jgi:hypothetical protein
LEKEWQASAILSPAGPLTAEEILALPDFDPGPALPAEQWGRW